MKILLSIIFSFALYCNVQAGFLENEEKILVKNCIEHFEKGKLLNKYINRYSINDNTERSDEYYEILYLGNYYNLLFGYKIYDKKFKFIINSECVTIDFDKANYIKKKLDD